MPEDNGRGGARVIAWCLFGWLVFVYIVVSYFTS